MQSVLRGQRQAGTNFERKGGSGRRARRGAGNEEKGQEGEERERGGRRGEGEEEDKRRGDHYNWQILRQVTKDNVYPYRKLVKLGKNLTLLVNTCHLLQVIIQYLYNWLTLGDTR